MQEHLRRRNKLLKILGSRSLAILPAASEQVRNRDNLHPFRQNSDFIYLTGLHEPDAFMVMVPGRSEGSYLLFLRPRDPEVERWDGPMIGLKGAMQVYGADQAYPVDTLDQMLLELKSKSADIQHLLSLPHNGRTVLAWSLNPGELIRTEEHRAANLDARIEAAVQAQKADYKLAFHFDPMIWHRGWEKGYGEVFLKLQKAGIKPENICWISIGSLRFPPEMKDKALDKFPKSSIFTGEMIMGKDNKSRIIKPLRAEMYQFAIKQIKNWSDDLFIYFCMEDMEIWQKCLPPAPQNSAELDYRFAKSLWERFPGLLKDQPIWEDYQSFKTPRRGDTETLAHNIDVEINGKEK